jgi:hypothetical protein
MTVWSATLVEKRASFHDSLGCINTALSAPWDSWAARRLSAPSGRVFLFFLSRFPDPGALSGEAGARSSQKACPTQGLRSDF